MLVPSSFSTTDLLGAIFIFLLAQSASFSLIPRKTFIITITEQ